MSDVMIKCFRCGKEHTVSEMRFKSSNNNDLICKYCLTKTQPDKKDTMYQTQTPVKNEGYELKKPKQQISGSDDYISYKCVKCGYTFKRKATINVDRCPYCGKTESVGRIKSVSADNLIDMSG